MASNVTKKLHETGLNPLIKYHQYYNQMMNPMRNPYL